MKYIRTNDGIYELMPNIEQDHKVSFDGKTLEPAYYSINNDWIAIRDVIKQGDTIEELCDRCVVVLKYGQQPFVGSFYEFEHFINPYVKNMPSNNPVIAVFGAIWTNKGLIYVAKMNKYGKLCLRKNYLK